MNGIMQLREIFNKQLRELNIVGNNLSFKNLFLNMQRSSKTGILKSCYSNLKIKHKLFFIHFFIILIVCVTSLAAIQITLNIFEGILNNESAKVLNLSTISIENELKQVERFSYNIFANPEIQSSLAKLKTNIGEPERSREGGNLTDSLWSITFERNITSVNLIDARGNQYAGGAVIPKMNTGQIINKASKREGAMAFIEPFGGDPSLICARQIRKIRNLSLETLGTLIIRVNLDRFVQQSTSGLVNHDINLLIISGEKMIYCSNPQFKQIDVKLRFNQKAGYNVQQIHGKNYFVAHTQSPLTGWVYVNVLPYETIFKQIILMRNMVLFIFLSLFCFTILISMKFAQNLTKPIENLTAKMKRVETGEFKLAEDSPVETERTDEIGDLQKDFMIMIQKIDALIKEDYTKQIVIKDAQLKALQAQINPHFLYNTLESINWLAKLNQPKDISLMVESLGHLLRSAINNQEQMITLKAEIRLLEDYITIQKIRFGERLDFRLEIDQKLQELYIPKLILQPVVENSINYGLEKMVDVCKITVKSITDRDILKIIVLDNGPGIEAAILKKLEQGLLKPKGTGIGLKNINERLQLIFGEQFGLAISSELGKGTQVAIRIPRMEANYV